MFPIRSPSLTVDSTANFHVIYFVLMIKIIHPLLLPFSVQLLESIQKILLGRVTKKIVHKHICGNSNYTDIKILLERNNLWPRDVHEYLVGIIEECPDCVTTALPKPARKASQSSMSRSFD